MNAAELPSQEVAIAGGKTGARADAASDVIYAESSGSYGTEKEREVGERDIQTTVGAANTNLANNVSFSRTGVTSTENTVDESMFEKTPATSRVEHANEGSSGVIAGSPHEEFANEGGSEKTAASSTDRTEEAHVEEDDVVECRVCGEGAFPEEPGVSTNANPLLAPCACRGSVAHIHLACLRRWVTTSSQQPSLGGFEHAVKCNACLAPWCLGPNRQAIASSPTFGRFLTDCVLPCCRPTVLTKGLGAAMNHVFLRPAAGGDRPCEEHLCCVIVRLLTAGALAALCLIQARVALVLIARVYAKFLVFDANLDRLLLPSMIEDWLEHNFPPLGCFEGVALPTLEVVTSQPFLAHSSASVARAFDRLPLVSLDDVVLALIIQTLEAQVLQPTPLLNHHRARAPLHRSQWEAARAVLASIWLPRPYHDALILWHQLFPTIPLLLHGLVSLPTGAYLVRAWLHRWSIVQGDQHPLDLTTGAGVGVLVLGLLGGLACASLALHALTSSTAAFAKWRASFALNHFFEALDARAQQAQPQYAQVQVPPSEQDATIEDRTNAAADPAHAHNVEAAAGAVAAAVGALAPHAAATDETDGATTAIAGALAVEESAGNEVEDSGKADHGGDVAKSGDAFVDNESDDSEDDEVPVDEEIHELVRELVHEESPADRDRIGSRGKGE